MPVPKPREGESKNDFISRCIRFLHHEDPDRSNDQNVAIAHDAWRDSKKKASLMFRAALHSVEASGERNLATFYLMNTSPNRLGWGVTDKALEEALPTLLGKTIGCGPGYKTDPPHHPNPMEIGKWVSFDKPNGYALATAEITDEVALRKLESKDWGPISVIITPYKERRDNGDILVESFTFKTVDFCDVPAFPQAGFMNFAGLTGETVVTPIELCASFYELQSIEGQAPGSPGVSLNPEEKRKMQDEKIEQLQEKVTELQASIDTLTGEKTTLETEKTAWETEKETLEAAVEELKNPEKNLEIKALEEKVAAMEAEKHQELLTACVEARFKAGLTGDKAKETEAIKDFTDDMLKFMTLEAGKVEGMKKASEPSGPKWKYTDESKTDLEAAIEKQREAYHFPPQELEATE